MCGIMSSKPKQPATAVGDVDERAELKHLRAVRNLPIPKLLIY